MMSGVNGGDGPPRRLPNLFSLTPLRCRPLRPPTRPPPPPPKNPDTTTTTKNTRQFTSQVIGAADSEFAALCREMDVEAQLADLEALCMRRGLSAEAQQ